MFGCTGFQGCCSLHKVTEIVFKLYQNRYKRHEVLKAVKVLMLFLWIVTQCGLVSRSYQPFEEALEP
jgi:hypothetical protein